MNRITGFVGFLVAIDSIQSNILWYFKKKGPVLYNYIPPRTLQLEVFFGALWSSRLLSYENMAYKGYSRANRSQDDESDYSDAPNSSNVSKFEGAAISICCSDGAEKNHLSCLSFICFSHFERPRKFVWTSSQCNISVHWGRKMFSANVQHHHKVGYHKVKDSWCLIGVNIQTTFKELDNV